ncbi:hypothetical protein ABH957_003114 [Bacillus sp. RC242]|uniref:hypothetical protein n=1 Tax=Bacillus sp. RC242 TaxID=3156286 RepID=UPI003835A80B
MEEEEQRLVKQIQTNSFEYLEQIVENTQVINEIISLLRKNNEINERTFELFQEVFTVITAETPEQVDGILKNVMNKANQANEDLGTIQAILGYGKMIAKLIFPDSYIFT